jgi:hypothetical protein
VIWLLSALGIGGIGAALFFIPGAMRVATEALSGALRLIRENPLLAIILGLLLACGWLWRADHHHVAQRDAARAETVACGKARAIERKSIATLEAALADQNAHFEALGKASDAAQKRAKDVLRVAVERGKASEGVAVRIERAAPLPGCVTSKEVLGAGL